jgi:adenine-specific DNA-methyltransferase
LEQEFAGKVKCIFIDPPYNTGSAFSHYDDGVEHSIWLSLMRDRLEILRRLLSDDGSIFAQADDNEGHYLKVLMDDIFGRKNFLSTFIWRKVDSPNDNKVPLSPDHEFIFAYSKDKSRALLNQKRDESLLGAYRGPDEQGRYYRDRLLKKNGKNSLRSDRPTMWFPVEGPDGVAVYPIHDDGREACWASGKRAVTRLQAAGKLIWKNRGTIEAPAWVPYTREFASAQPSRPFNSIWEDLPTTRQTKAHQKVLLGAGNEFSTPKPEALLLRILEMVITKPGDLVLDSFAGSGTTGAVAHKMHCRWIMIELGEHVHSHILPRMKKVIDGTDPGGVTDVTGWNAGGGFRYYKLAPSLLELDRFGNHVISSQYNAAMLAEAMCKLMGFTYQPGELYWQQGRSTENDFLYTTTQTLSRQQLESLSDEVGPNRSLLICCSAFRSKAADFPNLTVRKIPMAVLARCEWGKDDYSLNVANLPKAPAPKEDASSDPLPETAYADQPPATPADARRRRAAAKSARNNGRPGLFDDAVPVNAEVKG